MSKRIDNLTPQQRDALLQRLLQKKQVDNHQIPQRPVGVSLPLSHAQERLWFLDQLTPGNIFYNIPTVVPLAFVINIPLLQRVINEIVRRHESLRTTFIIEEGKPVQCIADELCIDLPVKDLSQYPENVRKQEAERLINEDFQIPFDITTGPLIRTSLISLGPQSNFLALTMHHIISDGWSMGVFFRELGVLYNAFSIGKPSPLTALRIQYADFAIWQRSWLDGEVLDRQLSYWKERLKDTPPLQLSTDRERPPTQSFEGNHHPVNLSSSLTSRLVELSEKEDVTLFMTLLAIFYTLLYRYTRQEDIAIGSYIANRNHNDIENLIGFFINTLVLRTDLSGAPTFRELLARTKKTATDAFDHQDLPFPRLVEEIQPNRDLSRNPIFQVVLQLINTPDASITEDGEGEWTPKTDWRTAIFDLIFNFYRKGDKLLGDIEYSTDLFNASSIEKMAQHFINLAVAITENPDQRLTDFHMIDNEERHQLVDTLNQTERTLDDIPDINEMFHNVVNSSPDAIAIIDRDKNFTYLQLATRVAELTHALKATGIGRESLVAVCLERSFDTVATILAIFANGSAYLPLDPGYPVQRLGFMLKNSNASLLLTRHKFWRADGTTPILWIDDIKHTNNTSTTATEVAEPCGLNQLAYVIYTSGSTGKPKGVCVEHAQIINRLDWMWQNYPFHENEVACHKTSLSFVDSIWEILGALLKGHPTVIIPEAEVRDPLELVDILARHKVTRLWLVPSLLRVMLESCPDIQYRLPSLRFWVSSGESLSAELFQSFQRQMPDATLYNLYGTSEVWDACWYEPQVDVELSHRVPIGKPIQNVNIFVLDESGQPVPMGVPGELHIAGLGLARNYLNLPDLTDEKFIPSTLIEIPDRRFYKTGDLVRWCSDGNLEFIGRVDNQVKIRGIRIELEEVEKALISHPGVDSAAVVVRDEASSKARLIAFVVQNPEYSGETSDHDDSWDMEKISQWRSVWDETYSKGDRASRETFNASGFISSYSGEAIPDEEVGEWVDQAVNKILSHKPERILEIGCGTGLLLWKLARSVKEYIASDFSPTAVSNLASQIQSRGCEYGHVQVLEQAANESIPYSKKPFDTIVLHSVAQYFPGVDYLLQVIDNALSQLAPDGVLYIGDVRDLNLLPAFYTSILKHSTTDKLTFKELKAQVHKRLAEEQELALDPTFFLNLKAHFPKISRVRIEPKRGKIHNEFSCFRYDVFIYTQTQTPEEVKVHWLDWHEGLQARHLLEEKNKIDLPVGIRGVPDSRTNFPLAAAQFLEQDANEDDEEQPEYIEDLQAWTPDLPGIDPETWYSDCDSANNSIDLRWSGPGTLGRYDVVLGLNGLNVCDEPYVTNKLLTSKPWHFYANNPLQGVFTQKMAPHLNAYLHKILPKQLIPASYTLLDKLPLTPSNKLDRNSLPVAESERRAKSKAFVRPSNKLQQTLADLYADVLGINVVGIHDDFFKDLGGHSLLAAQLAARIHSAFNVDIPLRTFFDSSTIAELENVIESRGVTEEIETSSPALMRRSRESFRETKSEN